MKKGDTVKDFLQKVKEQLIPEFRELRCMPPLSLHKEHRLHMLLMLWPSHQPFCPSATEA